MVLAPAPQHSGHLADRWAYVSPPLLGVSFSFGVRCADRDLGSRLDALLAPLRSPGRADHWFTLRQRGSDKGIELYLDHRLLVVASDATMAIAWLLWHLNRTVVDTERDHVMLHAGGVRLGNIGVVFPAPSGAGKSTLVGRLVQRGGDYLSDEALGVTLDGSTLLPFPKPLSVEPDSLAMLFGESVAKGSGNASVPVAPDLLRPASAVTEATSTAVVVVLRHRPGRPSTLTPISAADAFVELSMNAVNLQRHGGQGLRPLALMARRCVSFRLEMSDLDDACTLVGNAVDHTFGHSFDHSLGHSFDDAGPANAPLAGKGMVA
jgi:hypothetical protein